jgi:hypothetical protein
MDNPARYTPNDQPERRGQPSNGNRIKTNPINDDETTRYDEDNLTTNAIAAIQL